MTTNNNKSEKETPSRRWRNNALILEASFEWKQLTGNNIACFDARSLSLLIDAPFSLSNELSTMRCCCRRSYFLYSSSFLFVTLLEEKSEDGGSVYFLLVNCCWLPCCCRFLWISISRLMGCVFYVVVMHVFDRLSRKEFV